MTKEQLKKAKKINDRIELLTIELRELKKQYPILGESFFDFKFHNATVMILDTKVCNEILKESIEIIEQTLSSLKDEFDKL